MAAFLMWFSMLLVLVLVPERFPSSMCLDDIYLGFDERAAHSVNHIFSMYNVCLYFWLFPILVSRARLWF